MPSNKPSAVSRVHILFGSVCQHTKTRRARSIDCRFCVEEQIQAAEQAARSEQVDEVAELNTRRYDELAKRVEALEARGETTTHPESHRGSNPTTNTNEWKEY